MIIKVFVYTIILFLDSFLVSDTSDELISILSTMHGFSKNFHKIRRRSKYMGVKI
jgi:hypothetical protein